MQNKTQILILFVILLVLPISTAFACGNTSEKEKTERTSCTKENNHSEKKSCCNNESCNGGCDNTSCHCPSSLNTFVILNLFHLKLDANFNLLNSDWAFVQNTPKAVYLSIWQPPKIS